MQVGGRVTFLRALCFIPAQIAGATIGVAFVKAVSMSAIPTSYPKLSWYLHLGHQARSSTSQCCRRCFQYASLPVDVPQHIW